MTPTPALAAHNDKPVDVLAVLAKHARSHRSLAQSDAYSAQEAPKLAAALSAVAELIGAASDAERNPDAWNLTRLRAALARTGAES